MAKIKTTFDAHLETATLDLATGTAFVTRSGKVADLGGIAPGPYLSIIPISPKLLPKLAGLRDVEVTITVRTKARVTAGDTAERDTLPSNS